MKRERINEIINAWLHEGKNILLVGITMKEAENNFGSIVQVIKELQLSPAPIFRKWSVHSTKHNSMIMITCSSSRANDMIGRNFHQILNIYSGSILKV